MVPSVYVSLDALPLTPNGKVDRRALPEPGASDAAADRDVVAPRDPIELQLVQLWEDLLDVRPIGVQDSFFELGGHSLMAAHLVSRIEERFGRKLPVPDLFREPTIEHVAVCLRRETGYDSQSALVPMQPTGSKPPFFCVHPAPGTVFSYIHLAQHFGSDQPFYGLQARGLYGECEPLTQVEAMASCYVAAVREVQPEGPYHLGGQSAGAIIAFEMARQLVEQGEEVGLLALIDNPAPVEIRLPADFLSSFVDAVDGGVWIAVLSHVCAHFFGVDLEIPFRELRGLEAEEQMARFVARLKQANVVPPDLLEAYEEHSMMEAFVRMGVTNAQACVDYVPGPYPGRITVLQSSEAFRVLPPGVMFPLLRGFMKVVLAKPWTYLKVIAQACRKIVPLYQGVKMHSSAPSAMGWDRLSPLPVEIHRLPGNHVTVLNEPYAQETAAKLLQCLDAAQREHGV